MSAVPMGGRALALTKDNAPPRTLLVEPNFKSQIATERILRRLNYRWDLSMTSAGSLDHIKRLKITGQSQSSEYAMEYVWGVRGVGRGGRGGREEEFGHG